MIRPSDKDRRADPTGGKASKLAIIGARDKLAEIKDLNLLLSMAAEGNIGMCPGARNAITAGCSVIADLIDEVCGLLDGEAKA